MSDRAMTWARKVTGLGVKDWAVLQVLADRADAAGVVSWSTREVATAAGAGPRGVRLACARLEARGLLTARGTRGQGTLFRLALDRKPT